MKKKRYFWQPELSISIILWSLTFIFLFYGLIISLESNKIYWKGNLFIGLFLIMFVLSCHRFFILTEKRLVIRYALLWRKKEIFYDDIDQVVVRKDGLMIKQKGLNGNTRHMMSKKQKDRFLADLIKNHSDMVITSEQDQKLSHD